jgi:hypothetical protein
MVGFWDYGVHATGDFMDENANTAVLISKDQFLERATRQAERDYVKYRDEHPGTRCVGFTNEGKPCERFALKDSNLCQFHGGRIDKSLLVSSDQLQQFKPPKKRKINVAGRLNEIRNLISEDQQNILDSTEEIEILTARFQFLLEMSENLPQLSQTVIDEYDKWVDLRQSGNKVRFAEQTARLSKAIEDCRPGVSALKEFYVLTEQLRRFKETEIRRRIAMRQMLDAGDAAKLIDTMKLCVEAALAEIEDMELRKKVRRAFANQWRTSFTITPKEPTKEQMRYDPNPMA